MTFEETLAIVSRVRKLKQLARSPNPHEAALAAAKAEALMDQHHLRLYWAMWEQAAQSVEAFQALNDRIVRYAAARRKPVADAGPSAAAPRAPRPPRPVRPGAGRRTAR